MINIFIFTISANPIRSSSNRGHITLILRYTLLYIPFLQFQHLTPIGVLFSRKWIWTKLQEFTKIFGTAKFNLHNETRAKWVCWYS